VGSHRDRGYVAGDPEFLRHFDVIVFLMTTKTIFTPSRRLRSRPL